MRGWVPLWFNRLRVWYCHCGGSDCFCGTGSIPGLGISTCHGCGQKKLWGEAGYRGGYQEKPGREGYGLLHRIVSAPSIDRSLMIKDYLSFLGTEREATLQAENSFIKVHFSCQRVTSASFSELLLCLQFLNPMPKRCILGWLPFILQSQLHLRPQNCFLSSVRISRRPPGHLLLKPFYTFYDGEGRVQPSPLRLQAGNKVPFAEPQI